MCSATSRSASRHRCFKPAQVQRTGCFDLIAQRRQFQNLWRQRLDQALDLRGYGRAFLFQPLDLLPLGSERSASLGFKYLLMPLPSRRQFDLTGGDNAALLYHTLFGFLRRGNVWWFRTRLLGQHKPNTIVAFQVGQRSVRRRRPLRASSPPPLFARWSASCR
jgi:hypothetical protein